MTSRDDMVIRPDLSEKDDRGSEGANRGGRHAQYRRKLKRGRIKRGLVALSKAWIIRKMPAFARKAIPYALIAAVLVEITKLIASGVTGRTRGNINANISKFIFGDVLVRTVAEKYLIDQLSNIPELARIAADEGVTGQMRQLKDDLLYIRFREARGARDLILDPAFQYQQKVDMALRAGLRMINGQWEFKGH